MAQTTTFTIKTDQETLDRIGRRVAEYRFPPEPKGAQWAQGTDTATMRHLVERWRSAFDWRKQEAILNEHPQFIARVDGMDLHFVHRRASPQGGAGPLPVVLLHGWPSSFMEYLECGQLLNDVGRDVVIVSLPGFGFSDAPESFVGPRAVATLVHKLMTGVLGYTRYLVHGSDWGSLIAGWLGFDFPQACAGIHMTMLSPRFIAGAATEPAEQQWLAGFRDRFEDDGAYFRLHTSRPVTIGFALDDTPVGLLAWMAEKYAAWGDPTQGEKSELFRRDAQADRLIRNTMLYLVTGTAATSTWLYRGITLEGPPGYPDKKRVEVPVAIAATSDPIFVPPPRSLVEKAYNVTRWTDIAGCGHFPGYDAPSALAADIDTFAASL